MAELGRARAPVMPRMFSAGIILLLSLVAWTPLSVNALGEGGGGVAEVWSAAPPGGGAVAQRRRAYARGRRRRVGRRVAAVGDTRQKVTQGEWGGDHISLKLTGRGGSFELDCAHGTIDGPLSPDADGSFDARGRFVRERGGPEIAGQRPDSHPARFTGRMDGTRMTLRIVLTDSGESVGDFSLELGKDPQLTKCL